MLATSEVVNSLEHSAKRVYDIPIDPCALCYKLVASAILPEGSTYATGTGRVGHGAGEIGSGVGGTAIPAFR